MEYTKEELKELGFEYIGHEHNMFVKHKGYAFKNHNKEAMLFISDMGVHISKENTTLFRGNLDNMADLKKLIKWTL